MKSNYVRANYQVNQTVNFRVLSNDQCQEVYYAALECLERTGADFYSNEALEIYKKAGCWVDGNRVRFPSRVVEKAVRSAPTRITICDRNGNRSMFLEGRNTYWGPGPTNTYTLDPFTGERRRPKKSDAVRAGIVCDALPNIAYAMDNGTVMDVTPTLSDVHSFDALVRNTTKPIIHWGFGIDQYNDIIEMAAAVAGGLDELQKRPFIILYSESSPPLRHSAEAIDKAIFAAQKNVPVIYTPCTFAGGVAPATMAGSLVIAIADSLVGLVANQAVREGSPFIMGGLISTMDMGSSILAYGAPELSLLSAALTDIAVYIGLPMFSTGGCTDSKCIDAQWAAESAFSNLIAGLSGANIIHDCNYMEYGNCGSLELLVANNETIGMVKRIMKGIKVDDYTLAVDVVDKVGPGGHFLGEQHTIDNFRKETWWPSLISRLRYDEWKMEGAQSFGDRVKQRTQDIINNHRAEPLPNDVCEKLDAIIERAEAREAKLNKKDKK
ncbi:trimethylamine methyltransferase family protein [Desulfitibacter alkalitolerans]|uniref:trimethylamine methyltransferase family protein n=1 Tax=Desulfitibacter alkalitolerans TaxID=264641 RepID=UPI000489EDBF|nr:trimethylamine methyltransferase family protein [Desulfitibacter alkalitolerans]